MIGRIVMLLVAGDMLLAAVAWYQGEHWMANTQVAYLSSALVMGATMLSYARMVRARLEAGMIPDGDEPDVIDRLDDPHDLYSEETPVAAGMQETSHISPAEIKAAIREEKQRLKTRKRSPMTVMRDSRAFISFYRLIAYGLLIFGFLYLNGNHLLRPLPYLIGLGVPPMLIVAMLINWRGQA